MQAEKNTRAELTYYEKTIAPLGTEGVLDALKLLSKSENDIIRALYFSPWAISLKEIRTRITINRSTMNIDLTGKTPTTQVITGQPIYSFGTIEKTAANLVNFGLVVWRPSDKVKTTKGLFALNPQFYKQLKAAGYMQPKK